MLKFSLNDKPISPFKIILCLVIFVLVLALVFSGAKKYLEMRKEVQEVLKVQQINEKVLNFAGVFIDQVLRAKEEINFETRLKLENAVRGIGDEEILIQWQKFVESKTEVQAQEEVKNLLDILIKKIHPVK